ncbi:hypothetical protein ACJRO7_004402 [Eucalyptus globulus]|uniref:RNase H type-1 domain-containing protein n=1 Tax=Eucalyptus globulus TaxID=34317 RepID=A0ABD3IWI0_EUCGL
MDKWFEDFFAEKTDLPSAEMVASTIWLIWKLRNDHVFRSKPPKVVSIADLAHAQVRAFTRWVPSKEQKRTNSRLSPESWRSSDSNGFKLNIDCSWVKGEEKNSVAEVVRDSRGLLIDGFAIEIQAETILCAKALALSHSLRFLTHRTTTHVGTI